MAVVVLSDIVDVISEHVSRPSKSGYDIFVGLEHYDVGEPIITRYGSTEKLESSAKHFIKGDILVARRNVYLHRAAVANFEGLTSGDSIVLRVKDKKYADILPFLLNADDFWEYAEENSDGTMSKRLSPDDLLDYEFNMPDDYAVLAERLWSAYRLKQAYKRLLLATREMVKGKFAEMFGEAEKVPITDIFNLQVGKTPSRANRAFWDNGEYKWMSIADLGTCDMIISDTKEKISEKALSTGTKIIPADTIVMSYKLTIGTTRITAEEMYSNEAIVAFLPKDKSSFHKRFMYAQISYKDWEKGVKSAVKGKTLNLKSLSAQKLVLPSEKMQIEFEKIAAQSDILSSSLRLSIISIDMVIRSMING